jgi:hypothetical protein
MLTFPTFHRRRLPTSVFPLFASNDDGISPEQIEGLHRIRVDGRHRIIISASFVDDETIWTFGKRER